MWSAITAITLYTLTKPSGAKILTNDRGRLYYLHTVIASSINFGTQQDSPFPSSDGRSSSESTTVGYLPRYPSCLASHRIHLLYPVWVAFEDQILVVCVLIRRPRVFLTALLNGCVDGSVHMRRAARCCASLTYNLKGRRPACISAARLYLSYQFLVRRSRSGRHFPERSLSGPTARENE